MRAKNNELRKSTIHQLEKLTLRELAQTLSLRSKAYKDKSLHRPELADLIGRHYGWRTTANTLAAAMRIGYDQFDTHVSCNVLPAWLFSSGYADGLVVASRFFTTPNRCVSGTTTAREFFNAVWLSELDHGTRLCIAMVRQELIPFYLRLGFYYVVNSAHLDQRDRPACAMICPANEKYGSPYSSTFTDIEGACCIDELLECAQLLMQYRTIKNQFNKEIANGPRTQSHRASESYL